ncbi:MAG TPA: hypothetical protein VLL54_07680 [Pyrinomonadaceae bacterium]|nr:hypothetical protein [Pyrinomonadaceae bacterium]
MNCESLREIVSELAREGNRDAIDPTLRADTLRHLDECAECAQRFQDQRALTSRLQEMSEQMKSLTASPQVEERLRRAFCQTHIAPQVATFRKPVTGVNQWRSLALAAAVILIVAIAGLRWYMMRKAQPGVQNSNSIARTTAEQKPNPEINSSPRPARSEENQTAIVKKVRPRSVSRHVRPISKPNDIAHEVATQFMPIGFAGPMNPQDGGELVRVELTRSAMLSLGLPVNMDRFGESVKADVLLGPDGFARAIRFVQ